MKKLSSLLIGFSLALAGAALAQQPVEQQSPSKGKRPEKTHATQAQPGANAVKPQERPAKQTGAVKEHGAMNERGATNQPGAEKGQKTHARQESAHARETNVRSKANEEAATEPRGGKDQKTRTHQEP